MINDEWLMLNVDGCMLELVLIVNVIAHVYDKLDLQTLDSWAAVFPFRVWIDALLWLISQSSL